MLYQLCCVRVTILLIHPAQCLPWKVDKGRKETGLSMQRCFSQCIFPPVMSGLRASWVGKFVFKSLKGLPSPEFVSSPFCQCCLQWEANSEYWKREVTGKQCLAFELPRDQQVGVLTPAWENGILKHICLYGPRDICRGTAESPVQAHWGQEL